MIGRVVSREFSQTLSRKTSVYQCSRCVCVMDYVKQISTGCEDKNGTIAITIDDSCPYISYITKLNLELMNQNGLLGVFVGNPLI